MNDDRDTFGPNGTRIYHPASSWTHKSLGDAVTDPYQGIFDLYVKWTNHNIEIKLEHYRDMNIKIHPHMTEITSADLKKYFGTLLTQSLFKGEHMRLQEWINKMAKTMIA